MRPSCLLAIMTIGQGATVEWFTKSITYATSAVLIFCQQNFGKHFNKNIDFNCIEDVWRMKFSTFFWPNCWVFARWGCSLVKYSLVQHVYQLSVLLLQHLRLFGMSYVNPFLFGEWTYRNETQNILIRGMDVLWIWLPAPDVEQERVKSPL